MKAALVRGLAQKPVYGDFPEPAPSAGENRITITAAALTQVTKSRASGAHYSSSGKFPFVAGIDGVGPDGPTSRLGKDLLQKRLKSRKIVETTELIPPPLR